MKFPEVIDSSALATWRACKRKFLYEVLRRLVPGKGISVHLLAGGAIAKGLEVARKAFYMEGLPIDEAETKGFLALTKFYGDFEPPELSNRKSWVRVAGAYLYYLDYFPLGRDPVTPYKGNSGIEFSFAIPLDQFNPDHDSDPVIFAGRVDLLGVYNKGIFIMDDKTRSQLGPFWSGQWSLRGQFLGYCWAAIQHEIPINGVIVRGLKFGQNDFSIAQALEQYPQWLIDERCIGMVQDVRDLIRAYQHRDDPRAFPKCFAEACVSYGGCPFKDICRRSDPEPWHKQDFVVVEWNPLKKGD